MLTRREVIKQTALIGGYALSAGTISAILSGCTADNTPDWTPTTFSTEQGEMVASIANTILPKTPNSPGARDVGVHQFIDQIVGTIFSPKDRETFLAGLEQLNTDCKSKMGEAYLSLTHEKQLAFLNQLDQEGKVKLDEQLPPLPEGEEPHDRRPFFIRLKEMTIAGYFSAEQVGEEVLAYLPIPGEFKPCIPVEEVGKVWAE